MSAENNEKTGMRLLKKSRRGLARMVFSRAGLIAVLLLVQLAVGFVLLRYLREYFPHSVVLGSLFGVVMAFYLLDSDRDAGFKITWIVAIMLLPAFGGLLFAFTQSDIGHRLLKRRFADITEQTADAIEQDPAVLAHFAAAAPEALGLSRYVRRTGCYPVWEGSPVRYFPLGDELFPAMLAELEKAEKFIFLEYFIIDEGEMWGRILEILSRKAGQGVDVRLIYDGTCEFSTLPRDYSKRLSGLGIRSKPFAPVTPFISTHYNYRDHRKILVVDGRVAFNGGVNLADEYINRKRRFGHWKDSAVMVSGSAVKSYTLMFLQMWNVDERETELGDFLDADAPAAREPGFVMPYGDCPLDNERVGEWVYLDILNRARDYVYIMTPYLILNDEMLTALKFAAERGVDVRLMLPGIPDKRLPAALAKTHYQSLLASGVKIYEYTPGFVHAKSFVSDDREAVVGTINLDYRSLYHHFECGTWIYGCRAVEEIRADFLQTQSFCLPVRPSTLKELPWQVKLAGILMKVLAPLL